MGTSSPSVKEPPTNIRIWSDGQTARSQQGLISSIVAVSTLMLYIGWLHVMLALIVFSWKRQVLVTLVVLLCTLLLPPKPVLWPAFNQSWVFATWREYFNFSFLFGVFPLGPLVAGTLCQTLFPGFNIYSLAATSVFSVPGWRHFVAWIGSVPATSSNFKKLLKKGSAAVIVGGIAEMYMQHPKKERIKLRDRKGFVRVAVEAGIDGGIIPVYHFGNSQILDFYPQSLSSVSRKLRCALGFLYGRLGLPLPRKCPIFMVTGKPILVPHLPGGKTHPDFDKVVDEVHAKVVQALQELYDKHKASYGWQDRPLEIE